MPHLFVLPMLTNIPQQTSLRNPVSIKRECSVMLKDAQLLSTLMKAVDSLMKHSQGSCFGVFPAVGTAVYSTVK